MIKPLGNRVLIKVTPKVTKTASGIILTDGPEPKMEGKVIETATDMVKKGDIVLYSQYGPLEVKVEGEDYVIAEECHLIATIHD